MIVILQVPGYKILQFHKILLLLYLSSLTLQTRVSIYHMPYDVMQTKPYLLYNHQKDITLNEEEYIFLFCID